MRGTSSTTTGNRWTTRPTPLGTWSMGSGTPSLRAWNSFAIARAASSPPTRCIAPAEGPWCATPGSGARSGGRGSRPGIRSALSSVCSGRAGRPISWRHTPPSRRRRRMVWRPTPRGTSSSSRRGVSRAVPITTEARSSTDAPAGATGQATCRRCRASSIRRAGRSTPPTSRGSIPGRIAHTAAMAGRHRGARCGSPACSGPTAR